MEWSGGEDWSGVGVASPLATALQCLAPLLSRRLQRRVQAFIPPAFLFATDVLDWRDRGGGGDGGTGGIDPRRQLPRGGARRCHAGGGEEIEDDEHVGVASPLAAALQCQAPLVYFIVFPHFPYLV